MKKIISVTLAIVMLLSLGAISVSAADKTIDGTPDNDFTTVNYGFTASYTVNIPEDITATTSAADILGVKVTARTLGSEETLTVTRGTLTELELYGDSTKKVGVTLSGNDSASVDFDDAINVNLDMGKIQITGTAPKTGDYSGNLTFTCSVTAS